jgi:hypothetical protein
MSERGGLLVCENFMGCLAAAARDREERQAITAHLAAEGRAPLDVAAHPTGASVVFEVKGDHGVVLMLPEEAGRLADFINRTLCRSTANT